MPDRVTVIQITGGMATTEAIMERTVSSAPMNCTENVTIELASDGMIVHDPVSADKETEYYVIRDQPVHE